MLAVAEQDTPVLPLFATILVVFGQVIVAAIAGYSAVKIAQLKSHVNSRMDELLELNRRFSRAEGVVEGRTTVRAEIKGKETDALKVADALKLADDNRADKVAEVAEVLAAKVSVLVHRDTDAAVQP
jgi:predicted Holliday junction resolvase-like endonuclease